MCSICAEFIALDADDARAERLQKEQEQLVELDEYEIAELRRDMEPDDDWRPEDESYPSRA